MAKNVLAVCFQNNRKREVDDVNLSQILACTTHAMSSMQILATAIRRK